MERAIVLSDKDIKAILAEKYQVHEEDIFRSQYSYIVKMVEVPKEEKWGYIASLFCLWLSP